MSDCKNCKHYKFTRKICRLEKLGQACSYEPFEDIRGKYPDLFKPLEYKPAEVRAKW